MNVGNIIGGVLIVGLAGVATYFGISYARDARQGNAAIGPVAQPQPQPQNQQQVRVGTAPQQPGAGDNTAAQVQQWGGVVIDLFGRAANMYNSTFGDKA